MCFVRVLVVGRGRGVGGGDLFARGHTRKGVGNVSVGAPLLDGGGMPYKNTWVINTR